MDSIETKPVARLPACSRPNEPHEFTNGKECAKCGLPIPKWSGDCFSLAGIEMLENITNPDIRLVHAEVPDTYHPGQWIVHAWCEIPATFVVVDEETGEKSEVPGIAVIDNSQPDSRAQILPAPFYYARCTPRNIKRYNHSEMIEHALRHRHDGPWRDFE